MKKVLVALALVFAPVAAHAQTYSDHTILPKGTFVIGEDSQVGVLHIKVNLATQMAYVYRDDTLIALSSVSTGRDGYETPTGIFPIWGKETNHHSKHYDADMPFTEWLTHDGVALHAGGDPGRPSSHGCVHLPRAFAEQLFQMTEIGDEVEIIDESPSLQLALR